MTSNTAKLIATAMKRLEGRKRQSQVAKEAGFAHPNMLSMIKHGKSRLPLERVPASLKHWRSILHFCFDSLHRRTGPDTSG